MNHEFQMYKVVVEKTEEPEIKFQISTGSYEKQGNYRKTSTSATLTTISLWLCRLQQTGKLLEMRIPDHLTSLLRNLYAGQEVTVRTEHGTMDKFKIWKGYVKAVYFHPAYLTYMQSTSCKMLGWMKLSLESKLLGEMLRHADITPLMEESEEETTDIFFKIYLFILIRG